MLLHLRLCVWGICAFAAIATACGPPARPGTGDDDDAACVTGTRCQNTTWQTCQDGQWVDVATCPAQCSAAQGCIACDPDAATTTCSNGDVHTCTPDGGIGPIVESCGGVGCQGGQCLTECAIAASVRSYIGCEYWAVDLDNAMDILGPPNGTDCSFYGNNPKLVNVEVCDDGQSPFSMSTCDWNKECPAGSTCVAHDVCTFNAQHAPFAVVVSNVHATKSANVKIENAAGFSKSVVVAPRTVETIVPADLGFPDQSLDYSGIEAKAYKVTSDLPIIAYQFNPLNNVGVFSNDGSLLIPATAYDVEYYVLTHHSLARRPLRQDWNGYLTVVGNATQTQVTVAPTAATRQGTNVPAIAANQSMTFTLAPFETLTLEAVGNGDLTGTRLTCAPACGVFAGHEATNIGTQPGAATCCADHLEDQLFPASTWGKQYIVSRSAARTSMTPDKIRIVAQKPNTTLQVTPAVNGCTGILGPGQWCEFLAFDDLEIRATEPILVGHFLLSNGGLDVDSGDPALAFAIPVEQYRKDYTLLVPSQYDANFFAISAPSNSLVMLDGIDVTGMLTFVGGNGFRVGRFPVAAGQHQLTCSEGCGVEAEGWSEAVSYLYAGGLNLEQIVVQ